VEIETDKATVTYDAEDDGVLLQIVVGAGDTAPLGAPIAVLGAPGERAPAPVQADVLLVAAATNGARRVPASPVARRVAQHLGIDLTALQGSGPSGRVVRADVEAAAAAPVAPPVVAPAPLERPAPAEALIAAEPAAAPVPASPGARGEPELQPLSRLQQTVARRMAESRATVPDFELRAEVDMTGCVALREQLRALGVDPLPSYTDLIVKAAALALREFPRVNGAYRDGAFELFPRVNVGVAVAADDALLVPTVFDADGKSLGAIARTTRELAARARDGALSPAELAGGTFTVSNLGMFGIDSFSAVVNPPQAAILAVGSLRKRPVVGEDDALVARPTVHLALACDHRILYGADGARFLARVRDLLEEPLAFAL
jgi:pyruvate dehydrogenase E2 component (dihydrolipoamide acetyltransferase)